MTIDSREVDNNVLSPVGGTDLSTSLTFGPIHVANRSSYCFQAKWTGTPVGTWKVQESEDANNPATWTDVPDSSLSVSGAAGNAKWSDGEATCNWAQLVWTATSSTGPVTVRYTVKEM